MLKSKGKASGGRDGGGGLMLRVQAEGAQGIAAAGELMGATDKKPDPYVTFQLGGVRRTCAHVDDIEPLAYFPWPNAVTEFPVADEGELARESLVVHVKDKDLLKDRFIGGVDIPLGALVGGAVKGEAAGTRVLCQSRMFPLEFADEKRKSKSKPSGEVKLTITLADTRAASLPAAASNVKESEQAEATGAGAEQSVKPAPTATTHPSKMQLQAEPSTPTPTAPIAATDTTATDATALKGTSPNLEVSVPSSESARKLEYNTSAEVGGKRKSTSSVATLLGKADSGLATALESTAAATPTSALVDIKTPATLEALTTSTSDSRPNQPVRVAKRLKVELVSAVNLTRPISLGAIFDRKPDPFVVLEFAGITQTSTPLKDVDIKQPVRWNGVSLSFELLLDPTTTHRPKGTGSMDLLIHVKDENLTKPTYMGGAKVSLEEFFDTSAAQAWTVSSAAVDGVDRVFPLVFTDERMKKRKACGEITLRFHFELLEPPPNPEDAEKDSSAAILDVQIIDEEHELNSNALKAKNEHASAATSANLVDQPSQPVEVAVNPVESPSQRPCTDIQSLCVEVLCARKLRKPTAPSGLIKGMMKAVFDRKPDPYVILIIAGQSRKKTPAVKNADVAFVEWENSAQVFEFLHKPYPTELVVQVRDHDAVGSDPFMGGAIISLQPVWSETISSKATSELVNTYPLVFADEQMTKHQPCGELTLRFRWVYAPAPLPTAIPESIEHENPSGATVLHEQQPSEARESLQAPQCQDTCLLRYLSVDNLRLWNNPGVISASHDLYVEVSCVPRGLQTEIPKQRVFATSRALTDATKRLKPDAVVEWVDEALVIPVVVPDERGGHANKSVDDSEDILVELKDKNAIAKDTSVARKLVSKAELLRSCDLQGAKSPTVKLELEPVTSGVRGKKTASTLAFEMRLTLLPLDSLVMVPSQSDAATMTFFALTGSVQWDSPPTEAARNGDDIQFGLSIQHASTAQPKSIEGFLSSFSKPHIEDQVDFYPLSGDRSSVIWRVGFDSLVSSKQIQTAKEKEALDLDIQLWCRSQSPADKKKNASAAVPNMVGSYQVSAWDFLSSSSGAVGSKAIQCVRIPLGEFGGSMTLSYAISFRKAQVDAKKSGAESLLTQEPPLGNGNLHLLVLHAQQLIPPADGASDEKAEELDLEVRVAIEPKYVKRKESPVRAMLKTRPLENAGATPTWNEYLRLEYRLPGANANSTDAVTTLLTTATTNADEKAEEHAPTNLPAPIVVVGVYDIQIPGERSSSAIIGKTELPLSAFTLPKCSPSVLQPLAVCMTVDLHLAGKKTGRLTLEGVFEPLAPLSAKKNSTAAALATGVVATEGSGEDNEASYRYLCRSIGRSLRDKAKALKTGEPIATTPPSADSGNASLRSISGRIEVHVGCAQGSTFERDDGPISAHLWMLSAYNDRKELKSRSRASVAPTGNHSDGSSSEAQWDIQISLYTADIATDILRVELLSSTGTSLGSLKQPVSALLTCPRGQMVHDTYPVLAPEVPKAKKRPNIVAGSTLKLGLAFYRDQQLCGPVDDVDTADGAPGGITSIFVQYGRFIFADSGVAPPVLPATTDADDKGSMQLAMTTKSDLEDATLTCKTTLFAGAAGAIVPVTTKPQAVVALGKTSFVDWGDEVLSLEIECSALLLITKSYAIGTCPILRLELLAKRKTTRFHEVIVSYDVSLAALLSNEWRSRRLSTWAPLYSTAGASDLVRGKTPPLVGVMRLGIMVCDHRVLRSTNPFTSSDHGIRTSSASGDHPGGCSGDLEPMPGVLCIRFIAGRNLTDVDANGEQDPYVIARVSPLPQPIRGLKTCECISSVSLNGGRHPQWNSPVYCLSCSDMLTDYLRLEVIDSNEEDHLPDASIGVLNVALATLFRAEIAREQCSPAAGNRCHAVKTSFRGKTQWLEAWLPIYPVRSDGFAVSGPSEATGRHVGDADSSGDVRVEYRFVSYEYFKQSQVADRDTAAVSPYPPSFARDTEVTEAIETSLAGSIFIHVVGALGLPFSRGMQPAVRISCPALRFAHVTAVGKQSICDPVWDGEVVEIPFASAAQLASSLTVFVEIVDVAVRTANANALAVITFGSVNVDAFVRHPTATSYGFYPLGNDAHERSAATTPSASGKTHSSPSSSSLFLGCQFIPNDRKASCLPFTNKFPNKDEQAAWCRSGQLHVKALQLRFDLPSYFKEMIMSRAPALRVKLVAGSTSTTTGAVATPNYSVTTSLKELRVPIACTSISGVVASEGTVDWVVPAIDSERDPNEPSNAVLFEYTPGGHGSRDGEASAALLYQRANPILVCELVLRDGQDRAVVIGELQLPIFDFVLFDGHLASGWYPLAAPSDIPASAAMESSSGINHQTNRCGEVKLEVQFLPSLAPTTPKNIVHLSTEGTMTLVAVHVQQVRAFAAVRQGVYAVSVDLMGSRAETKPSMTSTRDTLTWDEVLELAVPKAGASDAISSMAITLRNLASDSKPAVASCNWMVPQRVLSSSTEPGDGEDDDDGIVVLQLFDLEWKQQTSSKAVIAEIVFTVQRLQTQDTPSMQSADRSKVLERRRGVLYAYLDGPKTSEHQSIEEKDGVRAEWSVSAAVCPASAPREAVIPLLSFPMDGAEEAESLARFQFEQFNAVPVPGNQAPAQLKLVMMVLSEQPKHPAYDQEVEAIGTSAVIGYAELSSKLFSSIVSQPRVEILQHVQVQAVSPTTPSALTSSRRPTRTVVTAPKTHREMNPTAPTSLSARMLFMNVVQGQFLVTFRSVTFSTSVLQAYDRFRVELRLLHNRSAWGKSTTARWNKERSRVEWSGGRTEEGTSKQCVKLAYSNEIEIAEPRLQLVLFGLARKRQVAGNRSYEVGDEDSGSRIAYGQVSLLRVLTEQDWNSGGMHDRQVRLMAISESSRTGNDDGVLLDMGIGFSGTECTNDELEAQRAQARKEQMLLLAEGTSTLKKMFVVLGGDEERPITIAELRNYLLSESNGDADDLRAAREVLYKAADQETDGDLDRLFAIMDVNGDGQISWDEYVCHMQTLYALADAASTHSLAREQVIKTKDPEDDDDEQDGDDDDEQDGDDDVEIDQVRDEAPEHHANSKEVDSDHDQIASSSILRVALPLAVDRSLVGTAVDRYDDPAPAPAKENQDEELRRDAEPLRREDMSGNTKHAIENPPPPAFTTRNVRNEEIDEGDGTNVERDARRNAATKRESAGGKRVATVPARRPLSTSILDWKVDEVIQWLEEEMELAQYADAFVRNAVNGRLLLMLSESELESELGVTAPLHKRKLVTHIAELQEAVGYPPPQREIKRTRTVRVNPTPQATETPAFIRREQLLYRVKQANSRPDETPFNSTKMAKKRPMQTTLVLEQSPALATASSTNSKARTRSVSPVRAADKADTNPDSEGESFADAMQDILEAVGASTPSKGGVGEPQVQSVTHQSTANETATLPNLPRIQIGSITSTDELFEIVKKRIHQLAGQLLPVLSQQDSDTFSDFGDGDDDANDDDNAAASTTGVHNAQQQINGLRLVFNAMSSSNAKETKLSRLRFQESLLSLIAIDASWHQFDLLFRRIDGNNNAELTFDEFQRVFRKEYIGFEEGDLRVLQDALVDFVVDRLDTQQWTLLELFKAFDRDGGGKISIAEFGTLVRFLFARTPSRMGRKLDHRSKPPHQTLSNRQIYLLLSCIDVSSDHRISQQEFLRFFFVVWSTRLMEVQDQLFRLEQSHLNNSAAAAESIVHELNVARRKLRRALRTNFSRPFRDAMRCLDVRMPSPFTGLLTKLQMLPLSESSADPRAEALGGAEEPPVQVWQVLKGQQPARTATSTAAITASQAETTATSESRKRVQKGKNEVLRTKLTRQREPVRDDAELRTPDARVALDQEATLKYDRRKA